jgi:hypothetical protein
MVVLLAAMTLWEANLAMAPLQHWDSAEYHLQAVMWAEQYPVVPGLANLFARLAYNSSAFLFDAMLNAGPWTGQAHHVANSLLIMVLLAQGVHGFRRVLAGQFDRRLAAALALLPIAVALGLQGRGSSLDTDTPATIVSFEVLLTLLVLLDRSSPVASVAWNYCCVVLFAAAAVSIKLSAGPFAVGSVAVATAVMIRRGQPDASRRRSTILASAGVGLAFAVCWSARGVVLSGYPFFPASTVLAAGVDWRLASEQFHAERAFIVHAGQRAVPNATVVQGIEPWGWLPEWVGHLADDPYDVLVPAVVAAAALAAALFAGRRAGVRNSGGTVGLAIVPLLVAVTAWFFTAPELRFAAFLFWGLAASGVSHLLATIRASGDASLRRVRLTAVGCLALALSPVVVVPLSAARREQLGPLTAIVRANLNRPGQNTLLPDLAEREVARPYVTKAGLTVHVPPSRCWDTPLPCTPAPLKDLRLRYPGRLRGGFTSDGLFDPEHWPESWLPDYLANWRAARRQAGRPRASGDQPWPGRRTGSPSIPALDY